MNIVVMYLSLCVCVFVLFYCCYLFHGYVWIYPFSCFSGCVILGSLGYLSAWHVVTGEDDSVSRLAASLSFTTFTNAALAGIELRMARDGVWYLFDA